MKRLFFLALVVVLALAAFSPVLAQDDTFDGRYTFDVPEGYTQSQGSVEDTVTLDGEGSRIIVIGPDSYNNVLGAEEFEDDTAALEFFLDRTGYTLEDMMGMMDGPMNAQASVGITLPRRNQGGNAWLVDVENGRSVVVISLHDEDTMMDEDATSIVMESLNYPADIVDVAIAADGFDTLVAAVQAAGLEDTLRDGEFTVFAPTDEAFADALEALDISAEDLLADTDLLTQILTYHVVEGTIMVPDAELTTVNGQVLSTGFSLDGAEVVASNIEAYNGVIHVIDTVLVPELEMEEEEESGD